MAEETPTLQNQQPVAIPRAEEFVESYVAAAPVTIMNDGSIAIEFLKPDVVLVVNENGQTAYQGQWISVGRFIMSPQTARRLLNDLYNILKAYESEVKEGGESEENGEIRNKG